MQTTTEQTIKPGDITIEVRGDRVNLGQGRYSAAMAELYKDSKRVLGLTDAQAHRLAISFGADLGRFTSKAHAEVKIGRPTQKDKFVTLREALKVKNVPLTHALCLARIVQELWLIDGITVNDCQLTLSDSLTEWLGAE